MCPSCPLGEKLTASILPGPGVCCPTITCEPIACTIDGVDYVAGETIPTVGPCEISWCVDIIILFISLYHRIIIIQITVMHSIQNVGLH